MQKFTFRAVIVFIALGVFLPELVGARVPKRVKKFTDRVVKISTEDSGFGFIVSQKGSRIYVVTANHVVRSMEDELEPRPYEKIQVTFSAERGKSYAATLLETNLIDPHDLAIIEVDLPEELDIPSGCVAKEQSDASGLDVWFIGRRGKFDIPALAGKINNPRPDKNDIIDFESNSVQRGTSGAPLLGKDGLMGMVIEDSKGVARALSIHLIEKVVRSWNYPWSLSQCRIAEDLCQVNNIGMQFVRIPEGNFLMGSTTGEEDEKPVHRVFINQPFCLGRYEVTQAQWETVMGPNANPSKFRASDRPVENVSWFQVQDFLSRLNATEDTNTYRLPTEAEWEYAARAGRTAAGPAAAEEAAWHDHNSRGMTQPVGRRAGNPWNLYDMLGNVWEWLGDYYGPYSDTAAQDPTGALSGQYRVVRGGSWKYGHDYLNFSFRNNADPGAPEPDLGFRVVKEIKE